MYNDVTDLQMLNELCPCHFWGPHVIEVVINAPEHLENELANLDVPAWAGRPDGKLPPALWEMVELSLENEPHYQEAFTICLNATIFPLAQLQRESACTDPRSKMLALWGLYLRYEGTLENVVDAWLGLGKLSLGRDIWLPDRDPLYRPVTEGAEDEDDPLVVALSETAGFVLTHRLVPSGTVPLTCAGTQPALSSEAQDYWGLPTFPADVKNLNFPETPIVGRRQLPEAYLKAYTNEEGLVVAIGGELFKAGVDWCGHRAPPCYNRGDVYPRSWPGYQPVMDAIAVPPQGWSQNEAEGSRFPSPNCRLCKVGCYSNTSVMAANQRTLAYIQGRYGLALPEGCHLSPGLVTTKPTDWEREWSKLLHAAGFGRNPYVDLAEACHQSEQNHTYIVPIVFALVSALVLVCLTLSFLQVCRRRARRRLRERQHPSSMSDDIGADLNDFHRTRIVGGNGDG